jgi:NAD(P)H dehydrogenase (quinone)
MRFDANLHHGYKEIQDLEPDLKRWQEDVEWATHLAWIYPYWWGSMPARMKGVIDRAWLPGFAIHFHDKDPLWERKLQGRSADVIITGDTPPLLDTFLFNRPGRTQVQRYVLRFAGIRHIRARQFGSVRLSDQGKIDRWIRKAGKLGHKAGRGDKALF